MVPHAKPTRDIDRAAFRQGPQGDQSGFSRRIDPGRAVAGPERHRHRPGGWDQQQRRQRGRQRVGRQKFSDGLLLHAGVMVGQNIGAARDSGDKFLAARANPAKPAPLRQRPRLCVHAQRHGHQVDNRAHFSYRRRPHLPRRRPCASSSSPRITASSFHPQQSYLGRALGVNPQVEIDYRTLKVEKGDLFLLATDGVYEHVSGRFIAETIGGSSGRTGQRRQNHCRRGAAAGQPGQPDRPDRPNRRLAG